MITKPVSHIEKADIVQLVAEQRIESKTLEFKLELPTDADESKREFLADVTAIANTIGGDIVYGIVEDDGTASEVRGLSDFDFNREKLRLESMLRDAVQPRLPSLEFKIVEGFPLGPVLVIRVASSWASPHLVTFKKSSRFFGRNSAGKYPLDVGEIRAAFLQSEAVTERIRDFRVDRLVKIGAGKGELALQEGPAVILQILPLVAFLNPTQYGINEIEQRARFFRPLDQFGGQFLINLNGVLVFEPVGESCRSYCQIYRTGIIEAVDAGSHYREGDNKFIAILTLERQVRASLKSYLEGLKELAVPPPFFLMLSAVACAGYSFGEIQRTARPHIFDRPISVNEVVLPEATISDYDADIDAILRPLYDRFWNVIGRKRSCNFNEDGAWVG